jgi:hypothetical protein
VGLLDFTQSEKGSLLRFSSHDGHSALGRVFSIQTSLADTLALALASARKTLAILLQAAKGTGRVTLVRLML